MSTSLPTKLSVAFNSLFLLCVATFVIRVAYIHVELISHAYPLDYNETAMLVFTSTIVDGGNPFSLESQPSRMSLYPVLYNILVAPLSAFFGNSLELHRIVAGLFILACSALCFYLCRRESGTRTDSFIAAALFYAALLFYSTPIASPNSVGLFLFLCAITVPWVYGFSTRSLFVTILLGILAFYTKQYFIACLGYVALYLFIAQSKKRAICFGFAAFSAFIVILVLVSYTSPYYLEDTFFAVQSSAELVSSDGQVLTQFWEFTKIYLPLLLILSLAIIHSFNSRKEVIAKYVQSSKREKFIDLFDPDKPLLLRKPNYIWVCFGCSVIIIVLVLGRNHGNHLTYLFQLMSPFLLVGIFAKISDMRKWRWPIRILIVFALYNSYSILTTDFSVEEKGWQIIRQEIANADDIYASTLVLKEVMEKGAPVYQNGHTRYFIFGKDMPSFLAKSDPEKTVPEIWERHVQFIQNKIKNQEFDLLLIDQWMPLPISTNDSSIDTKMLLKNHYKRTANISLPLANRLGGGNHTVQVWKPIPAALDTDKK